MLKRIIEFSISNKLIIILFSATIVLFGIYAVFKISVGAVPDITNNQVQVITTSSNLSTQEIEQFITAPVEMEMANLPGVIEIRSVSKFGISLVTIVFNENLGTYLPRQLIAEKIKTATAQIPQGFGEPEMGPITTGLGEIYQYTLDVKPGYENQYNASELRTIQDWVIKRRLSGINGVVEINSWGGLLKQFEVAITPQKLVEKNIALLDIFDALEANNSISGGSYIEKSNQSYFIRGDGQVKSIEDIENIVIKNNDGIPILIRDIANVKIGHANRYGAITANGKGETILGQVMMLKNANSKQVIQDVKDRVEEVQQNLPEGIFINPIVDRSELVAKTTFTVAENLILGAIIVMFTVILILGNLRSALVITSIIPMSLLFTISIMYIFGIDANLMSLGALDFGIIIDGAVIIVEYIALKLFKQKDKFQLASTSERRNMLDDISMKGASKMMQSAIFGQLIILIVFIPIISLTGVEGKMFRPMALAFCFALIGAMILGLTWLPVACALFLKPVNKTKKSISDRIIELATNTYLPVIRWAFRNKTIIYSMAIASLVLTFYIFINIGGEFVPTLDEGDFVIQPVLKTGTSLSKTIETTTKMEQILINNFSEVDKVVSRIGAAEVPTDPMSMEEIDMIIKLKPRSEWKNANSKEELANKFKDALSVIPGMEYEFTQPIEMRFNELITGVRSDIAIKIFGEDLDYIDKKANEIKKLIENIPGASDVILEKTAGLPQIKITYDRRKISLYNIDIKKINSYLSTAFGGSATGVVFEGEKRFDIVVRFDETNRTDIDDINRLTIPLPSGNMIPISELAKIEYTTGPAKISRENTHRRVVVSVNVRNRDLQSVVKDIQSKIDKNIKLQPGNYIVYGGQFENLQNATNRLLFTVPIAMLLIFIFLHFAFKSIKDAIMIYSAIPLAIVGGVFALFVRGMPFSVSAGIGFIALFGIAALNGIVLIEHLKELKHKDEQNNLRDLIIIGAKERLRPVMLTAGAAAMGFLPMAISTGSGAEVQKPLATVVIGGLFTSTMLTMIMLPLLYEFFYNLKPKRFSFKTSLNNKTTIFILLFILSSIALNSQPNELSLDQIIQIAKNNNKELKAYSFKINEKDALVATAFDIDKTIISYGIDNNNIAENNFPLRVWGIEQHFDFPTLYWSEMKSKNYELAIAQNEYLLKQENIVKNVSKMYYDIQYLNFRQSIFSNLDSLYKIILISTEKKKNLGDANNLELLNIRAKSKQIEQQLINYGYQIENSYKKLKIYIGYDSNFSVLPNMEKLNNNNFNIENTAYYQKLLNQEKLLESFISNERNKFLPDITLNYYFGTNSYENSKIYTGFEIGIGVPLFFTSQSSKIEAAKYARESQQLLSNYEIELLRNKQNELLNIQKQYLQLIEYYNKNGEELYKEIIRAATISYNNGQIDFFRFVNSIETALQIRADYIENLLKYNETTIELIYLTND